jgi:hypothetical protein
MRRCVYNELEEGGGGGGGDNVLVMCELPGTSLLEGLQQADAQVCMFVRW